MSIGDRMARGWQLSKQSLRVLMLDKELLVFPLISAIAAVLIAATFIVPLFTTGHIETLGSGEGAPTDPIVYVWAFTFYFANYFVVVFFNTAIVSCALERLRGGDPTVGSGPARGHVLVAAGARLGTVGGHCRILAAHA